MQSAAEFIRLIETLFCPGDVVLVRPVETWTEDGKKRTRVDQEGIEYWLIGMRDAAGTWQPAPGLLRTKITQAHARHLAQKTNLFFGVCPRLGGHAKYDLAWQIRTVRVLWLDIDDCKPDEAALRLKERGFPRPSVLVGSGNGTHAYWVLAEPYIIGAPPPQPVRADWVDSTKGDGRKRRRPYILGEDQAKLYLDVRCNVPPMPDDAQRVQDLLSGMASAVGGDHTGDLTRLLRLPGTLNQKNARNGTPPTPCTIVDLNDARHNLADFERFLANSPARIKRAKIAQVPLREARKPTTKTRDKLDDLLTLCATAEVGERSERDFSLCCFAVEHGISRTDAWQRAQAVGKFAEKGGEGYFDRTWTAAEQHTREQTYEKAVRHTKPQSAPGHARPQEANGQPGATVDALSEDRKICEELGIDVLGEVSDGGVKVFSRHFGKTTILKRVVFEKVPDLLQKIGPVAREKLHNGQEDIPGMYRLSRVHEAIALLGGAEAAGDDKEMGQGVWRAKDDLLVLVNPKQSAAWDGRTLEPVRVPRIGGLTINMDLAANQKWFEHDRLADYLSLAANPKWAEDTIGEAAQIFHKWNWRKVTMDAAAELVAGLILCTFVESAWTWRPLVAITAESDAGKSLFFETLASLFGPLALLNAKSTEAGIRQSVGQHAKAILCDEFESDDHRDKILEFFRTASRGSQTLRGTSGQVAQRYGLRHIPWCAAVGIKLDRAPDRNRFIFLEFSPVPQEQRGKIDLPSEASLADLGQRLLAIAVRHVAAADRLAVKLRNTQIEGVHGRVVESYSTPAAMLATACGLEEDRATNLIRNLVAKTEQDAGQATKDQTELLGDILSSEVNLDHGSRATVAQILYSPNSCPGGWEALERMGIRPIGRQGTDAFSDEFNRTGLFIASGPVRRYLLRGTRWAVEPIEQILLRLAGSEREQHHVGGHRPRGVTVSWPMVRGKFMRTDDEVPPDTGHPGF